MYYYEHNIILLPGEIKKALNMFQVIHLLNELLNVCIDSTSMMQWPWCARLVEHGLQLDIAQVRELAIQLSTVLLKRPKSCDDSVILVLVELLQSNGHHCLAYHTTILVR